MKKFLRQLFGGVTCLFMAWVPAAHAIPTFQVYIDGASAGTMGTDQDTWFGTAQPFTLVVVGAYGSHTTSLTNGTLVLSIPEGQSGTVSFSSLGDGVPSLLTLMGGGGNPNPSGNATEDHLTDIAGSDGYNTKAQWKPTGLVFPPHDPTGDGTSDFILYSLGGFSSVESNLKNYDADAGTITTTSAQGEEKRYSVNVSGFTRVHFDLYGFKTVSQGESGGWKVNPGSHDSTWKPGTLERPPVIPEPGSLILMACGLAYGSVRRRRRRTL